MLAEVVQHNFQIPTKLEAFVLVKHSCSRQMMAYFKRKFEQRAVLKTIAKSCSECLQDHTYKLGGSELQNFQAQGCLMTYY